MQQFGAGRKPATGIVYDSDLGGTIDSVLALALLHGFEGKTQARIAALTINKPGLASAQLCDVIEKFYQGALTGAAAIFFNRAPIGLTEGKQRPETPIVTALLTKMDDSGKPVYVPRVSKLNETAIPEVLIRNALSAQYDQNAAVVSAGPATNLLRLLDLTGAQDLIRSKVRVLVVAEQPASTDPAADKRLLQDWPGPIVLCGREIGEALLFPASSIENDFAYAPAHPVAEAYRAYKPMPYDAPSTDMAAILYAVRSKEPYFKLSEDGKVRRLSLDPTQKEAILKIYTQFASAKPVPRTFRFPVADDQKKVDEKPEKQ